MDETPTQTAFPLVSVSSSVSPAQPAAPVTTPPPAPRSQVIAVSGPGADATPKDKEHAREVGRLLAEAGYQVITGGLGGVMEASSQGAAEAGGTVIALLPGDSPTASNPHAHVSLPTGLGELRNGILIRCAVGVIVVGGSWGTMSEVALAMRTGVPVVVLGGWKVTDAKGKKLTQPIPSARTPKAAVRLLRERLEKKTAVPQQLYSCL